MKFCIYTSSIVISDTAKKNSKVTKKSSALFPAGSFDSNRIISPSHKKHSNQPLVSLDNKITSPLLLVFLQVYKFLGILFIKMTLFWFDHDGYLTEVFFYDLLPQAVDGPADLCCHLALVGTTSLTTFCGVNVAVFYSQGVVWYHWFVYSHILKPDRQFWSICQEQIHGHYVFYCLAQAIFQDVVEGVQVGLA